MYRQVELRNGASRLICWLEWDGRLKLGNVITLEEIPNVKWKIKAAYGNFLHTPPRTTWTVGGL